MPNQVYTPASLLAKLLNGWDESPQLIIISGPSGAGKSSYCLQVAELARAERLLVCGLISPAVYHDGRKTGIDMIDQLLGTCRRLGAARSEDKEGIKTTNWLVDPFVLAWGDQLLTDLPDCDMVFIDELGPLEFIHDDGLQAGLKLIDKGQVPIIIAVIRPSLLALARARWPWASVLTLDGKQEARLER